MVRVREARRVHRRFHAECFWSLRFSRDLDYFHDSEARVAEAFAADRRLIETSGCSLDVDLNQPGYIRAIVRKGANATKVEWSRDSAWRFMLTVRAFVDPRQATDAVPHFRPSRWRAAAHRGFLSRSRVRCVDAIEHTPTRCGG